MPFSSRLRQFFEEMSVDVIEERVIEYVVRELHQGRPLKSVLADPYVKNRLGEDQIAHVLENTEVVEAVDEELRTAFKTRDFKFSE